MRKRRGIDRVRWGLGRRSLLKCRYLTSGGIKTVGFLCSRDEPGWCPPTWQVVIGLKVAGALPVRSYWHSGRRAAYFEFERVGSLKGGSEACGVSTGLPSA